MSGPLISSEFSIKRMEGALQDLYNCMHWLSAEDNFDQVSHEVNLHGIRHTVEDILRRVYSVHNRRQPVNTLPPEILGTIFQYAEDIDRPLSTSSSHTYFMWPTVQSICRYWRHTALLTPALWSYISLRDKHLFQRNSVYLDNIAAIHLQRSGVLPLTVDIFDNLSSGEYPPVEKMPHATLLALQGIICQSSRIRGLRLQYPLAPYFLYPFTLESQGHNLVTLALVCSEEDSNRDKDLLSDIKAPRLRTLCLNTHSSWTTAPFRTLRELVLSEQEFGVEAIRALHRLLLSNPCLTDMVLTGRYSTVSADPLSLESLSRVDMPRLKTILTHDESSTDILGEFVESKLTLRPGFAKVHRSLNTTAISRIYPTPEQFFFPLSRLFIGSSYSERSGRLLGTDGISSFYVHTSIVDFLERYSQASHLPIPELWLFAISRCSDYSGNDWSIALRTMTGVKKLVLRVDIATWLTRIYELSLFPSLSELQLHIQSTEDISCIFRFLKKRRDANHPVETLRFVLHAWHKDATETFLTCRKNAAEFGRFVPHVLFANPDTDPPEMELPEICRTESPLHDYWHSWSYHMAN